MSIRLPFLTAAALLALTSACAPLVMSGATSTGVAIAQERSVGSALDDATIHSLIWSKFLRGNTPNLYSNVGIEVNEGRVLLTGPLPTAESAARAVQMAWEVEGVKEVINEIQISERSSADTFARDGWITSQVKARLVLEKGVKSINYTIETVNGTVYIMGIAQDEDELARVLNVASRVKGVQKVISHAQLKTDPRRTAPPAENLQGQPAPVENNGYDNTYSNSAVDSSGSYGSGYNDTLTPQTDSNYTDRYGSDASADYSGSNEVESQSPFTPQY